MHNFKIKNIHNKTEFTTKFDIINEDDNDLKRNKNLELQVESDKVDNKPDEQFIEPLLKESVDQYVIFPIKHEDIWEKYKLLVENFWSATENLEHLELLVFNANEYKYLRYLCEFFSCFNLKKENGGGLVNENFSEEFSKLVQVTEAKFFYGHLLFVQNVHYEMFNKLHEVLAIKNVDESCPVRFDEDNAVKQKCSLLLDWYTNESSFAQKLVLSACLHGLLFAAMNLTQQWIDKRLNIKANHELVDNIEKLTIDQVLG
jgi:ribonucleoside-diphosphate reductase beta chain